MGWSATSGDARASAPVGPEVAPIELPAVELTELRNPTLDPGEWRFQAPRR